MLNNLSYFEVNIFSNKVMLYKSGKLSQDTPVLPQSCNQPRNFIAIASIVLEICTGQNSSMKINKGQ